MKRFKNWSFLVIIMVIICMMFVFVACNDDNNEQENSGTNSAKSGDDNEVVVWTAQLAFAEAKDNGFSGTFEDFLNSLAGIKSVSIVNGDLMVTLGDDSTINAGCVVGAQGVQGEKGENGAGVSLRKTDSEIQMKIGENGEWVSLVSLIELKGDQGIQGVQGEKGDQGNVGRVGFVVSNSAQLVAATNVPNSYIVLANDIIDGGSKISIQNDNKALNFVLDLNGKNISSRLAIYGVEQTVNALVMNGTLGNESVNAGLYVGGSIVTLNVENVKSDGDWYGFATNGMDFGSIINAKDCTFVGHCEGDNAGAYLPAEYRYKFENCTFEGYTGVATKSGTHTYTNCAMYGNGVQYVEPAYNRNGVVLDGCGLSIQYTPGYKQPLTLTVNGGEIKSDNAYAISECTLSNTAEAINPYGIVAISEETELTAGEGYVEKVSFNKVQVTTAEQLVSAVNNAENSMNVVMLMNNIDITETGLTVASNQNVVLNLNGNNLKVGNGKSSNIKVLGKMILEDTSTSANGRVYSEDTYAAGVTDTGVIYVYGGEFVMNSGNIYTVSDSNPENNGEFGIAAVGVGSKVVINGGTIESGWYAVSTNGRVENHNIEIIINGGKLISTADYAVYLPAHDSSCEINGGYISGACGAVSINAGSLIVNGGSLNSLGIGNTGEWSDGTSGQNNAVINVWSKYGETNVVLNAGEFVAEGDAVVVEVNNQNCTSTIVNNVEGLVVNDKNIVA